MLMDKTIIIKNNNPKLKYPSDMVANFKSALVSFMDGETGIFGNYVSTSNALVYRSVSVADNFGQDVLILRLIKSGKVHYLGNASRLRFCETKVSFGNRSRTWGETKTQKTIRELGIPMLPFQSFTESGLKLVDAEILEQTGAEVVERIISKDKKGNVKKEQLHFTGASLFQVCNKQFLFDIDREEIKHGIFNPFIVQLPDNSKSNTVNEAYDSLVPEEVKTALKNKEKVLRQGEYFFIKVVNKQNYFATKSNNSDWDRIKSEVSEEEQGMMRGVLSAQGNRDHITSLLNTKTGLVSGIVVHMGREHAHLNLRDGWYKTIPNTAVRSFTVTGDID